MKRLFLIILVAAFANTSKAQIAKTPTFEEIISLQSVSNAVISPDGNHIVYEHRTIDWKEIDTIENYGYQKMSKHPFK